MNLLCPNCGKMLTVPEQYAGQMMKCPLCNGTFTVPALPSGPVEPSPPPPPVPAGSSSPYELHREGPAEPAFPTQAPAEPAFSTAPPQPAFTPAPPPVPPSTATTATGPSLAPGTDAAGRPLPSLDYRGGFTLWISDKILRWVAPACLVVIFVLLFFPWVGIYPGGVPAVTQSAWSAAFAGRGDRDLDLKRFYLGEEPRKEKDGESKDTKELHADWSPLLILYLLLFLVTMLLGVAIAVLPFVQIQLPPPVQQFLPWQWAALAGLNAVLLLFLILQMLLGFGLENSYQRWIEEQPILKKDASDTKERKLIEVARGSMIGMLHRTIWMRLAFLLQLVAAISAGLVFWIEKQRARGAPLPRIDVKW